MIHIGEGMNDASAEEVRRLLRFNLFRRPLIGIHGLALTPGQSERFKALVWCPASNHFLFGATARVEQMRTTLLFGTDSTLTATWDLWEQLREARATQRLSDEALFNTLTGNARRILQLPEEPVTSSSDFVLLRKKHTRFFDAFYAAGPEDVLLVVVGGRIRLIDGELLPLLEEQKEHFSSVSVHDSVKWVEGDLPALMAAIRRFRPEQAFPVRGLRSSPAPAAIAG
jgi:cytosine/adenosine deaminase-related metal-dependent hydrolase